MRFALPPLVDEVAAACGAEIGTVAIDNATDGAGIEGDRDQLFRALLNLARNAIEAGATRLAFNAGPGDAGGVEIEVADNGHGLPPRARDNLFRPFVGSVRPGGTGLGLAIGRELARVQGGDLKLAESSGRGARFAIELPDRKTA